jgi:hypothetical protein
LRVLNKIRKNRTIIKRSHFDEEFVQRIERGGNSVGSFIQRQRKILGNGNSQLLSFCTECPIEKEFDWMLLLDGFDRLAHQALCKSFFPMLREYKR